MQLAGHPQSPVFGTVVHKNKLELGAVALAHCFGYPRYLFVKQRHRFLLIVAGHYQADQHPAHPLFMFIVPETSGSEFLYGFTYYSAFPKS